MAVYNTGEYYARYCDVSLALQETFLFIVMSIWGTQISFIPMVAKSGAQV